MYKTLLIFLFACAMAGSVSGEIRNENLHQDTSESFFVSKTALFGYGMIAGIVVAVGIVLLSIEKTSHRSSNRQGRSRMEGFQDKLRDMESEYAILETECKKLKAENGKLQRRLDELEESNKTAATSKDNINPSITPEQPKQPEAQASTTLYYLQPGTDSRFKEQSKVNSAMDALYALTYQSNNPSEAALKFIDTRENTFLAVQNESTWILVACERSNVPTEHTTSIRTDVPGKAILRNKEWEILQKAKITYL